MASAFTTVKQVDQGRQQLIQAQLRRLLAVDGLSDNVSEILNQTVDA